MEYGIVFANTGTFTEPEGARALATIAEEVGFESLWTVEHVVVPAGYQSAYPYSKSGRMPGPEDGVIPDPFIWLSYVAAASTTLRLATGVTILPQRNPLVLAKAVATLDRLSGGRVILGVGAGWLAEEFDAIGVPFEGRGRRMEENIGVMRALWSQPQASFAGEFVNFQDCISRPQPAAGTVPIHVGGHSETAARRAGAIGDGFFPGVSKPETVAPLLEVMRKSATDAGRDPDAIEVTAGGALDADSVKRYEDLGVHRIAVPPLSYDPETLRSNLETFATEVMAKV